MEEKIITGNDQIPPKDSNKKFAIVLAVAVLLLGGAYLLMKNKSINFDSGNMLRNQTVLDETNAKVFDISSKPFEFSQKEIRVKKGDVVRINLSVTGGMHDWVVDEFNARTKQIAAGGSDSVVFLADKAGTFEYYCSVGTHRQMGMVGKLIVE